LSDELDFSGKTLLVTGSGRNIGRGIALEFADRGANVIVNARTNVDEAKAVADEIRQRGVEALVLMGAPSDEATVDSWAREVEDHFGHLDMYVSNAARRLHRSFFDTSNDDWHNYLNQQLTASWYLAKAFVPGMREAGWGRIIHINGPDGYLGGWTRVPHSTAKGGLRTLTKSLAEGLGEFGITVNDVSPGFIETIRDPETHPQLSPEATPELAQRIPIKRQPTISEMAWACAFLCSPRSGAITGSVIHVDGGQFRMG
jgi:3-oxoacyl-[acyl-carrier protein] reductase